MWNNSLGDREGEKHKRGPEEVKGEHAALGVGIGIVLHVDITFL